MSFPVWQVSPALNGSVLIGVVAVFHVFIALLAVGAGIFLPVTEYIARKQGRQDLLEFLRYHTRFFVVLTSVFGAVSGIGIWFTISLVHPAATTALIHKFVFAWGMEYAIFLVEITSLIFYYYGWEKMDASVHQKIGWIYAGSAFGSLFFINGILTYMLTPGQAAMTTVTDASFFQSFFNPGYGPSLIMRLLVALSLAGLFALFVAAKLPHESDLRTWLLRYSAQWLLPSYVLLGIGGLWYLWTVPQESLQALTSGIASAGVGNLSVMTRVVMLVGLFTVSISLMVFFGPYLNPTEFSRWKAGGLLLSALFVTGAGEWAREMLRKPYVIRDFMYVNGVLAATEKGFGPALEDASAYRQSFLSGGGWDAGQDAGAAMFKNQCLACHTLTSYRSLREYLAGRDEAAIHSFLQMLQMGKENPYRRIMPPLIGTPEEVKALAHFLSEQVHPQAAAATAGDPSPGPRTAAR
ncbi:MAG: cytochrome ubiquinol oxidase subunit I [Planctomycetes bacterium]|nr:cytochrome ubiquinol oxidase subunit I [Planctomycetota bacterium]